MSMNVIIRFIERDYKIINKKWFYFYLASLKIENIYII